MRALVISDTHFGAWTGRDLLAEEPSLERLAPHLEGIDELIILGDLFDFLFASVADAFAAADGLFGLAAEKLGGGRLVFLAGNHDHHFVHRDAEDRLEAEISAGQPPDGPDFAPAHDLLPRLPRAAPARGGDRDRLSDLPLRRRPPHPRPLPRSPRPAGRSARLAAADQDAVGDRHRRPRGPEDDRRLRVGDHPADRVALHRRADAARHPRPAERLPGGAARWAPRLRRGRAAARCARAGGAVARDAAPRRTRRRCPARSTSARSCARRPSASGARRRPPRRRSDIRSTPRPR